MTAWCLGDEYMDRSLPKIDACMVSRALQINAAIAEELIAVCDSKQVSLILLNDIKRNVFQFSALKAQ